MGKKQHKQQVLRFELIGLGVLALAVLSLGRLGIVGRSMDIAFIYLAGSWYFLVPIFVGYAALYMMFQRSYFPWTNRHMGILILFLTFLTGMEWNLYQQALDQSTHGLFSLTLERVEDMSSNLLHPDTSTGGDSGAGGGFIGYLIFSIFHYLFSTLGTIVVLVFGMLVGGALVTQQSLVTVVQKGTRWMEGKLEGLWKGSKAYIDVLFGRDGEKRSKPSKRTSAATESEDSGGVKRRTRRKPQLILDGEEVTDTTFADEGHADVPTPIVHDFAAKLRQKHQLETHEKSAVQFEQVENRIVARYADAGMHPESRPEPKAASEMPYEVGVPIHDENYQLPPLDIFSLPSAPKGGFDTRGVQENARKLEATLESFGVQAKVLEISRGPTVTRYEVQPAVGVKVSRIVGLTDDIALALAARDIRMEAPVPGKSVVGIEVPNTEVSVVTLREVLESSDFQKEESKLAIALGRDISGAPIVGNLQKMPHLLVAGATGSGKSVCVNGMIASILVKAKPHEVKFLMIDPKMVELSGYNGIPHLLAPVVTDPRKAAMALKKIIQEMENRYQSFADRGTRDIERYNQLLKAEGLDPLPYIVVIVDELADLMMVAPGDVEDAICRIAQMARAAGIHLIVATQRPSVDVITGVIKANIPSRIAFSVSSMADSRTILDGGGAEKLLGRGDMLYLPSGASKPTRVQGNFVAEQEIEKLVEYVKEQQNAVYVVDLNHVEDTSESTVSEDLDSLFVDAVDLVVESKQASVSMIQRRFRVGYSRAARIVDQMELQGLVGPFEGSKPREVLISAEQWHSMRPSYQNYRSQA